MAGAFSAPSAAKPRVEAEEAVYEFQPPDNGAGPLWDYGAPGLVRRGTAVYAAGLDTIPGLKPLNNCRWVLYGRGARGWQRLIADEKDRQREPCPIAIFKDGRLLLSTNPTLAAKDAYNGPADPQILVFAAQDIHRPPVAIRPAWSGQPRLTEHTYRGLGVDAANSELILLHNDARGGPRAHWAFLGRRGEWVNQGVVTYPIRGCYPQVALRQGAAHALAVGDIKEPVAEWRKWKLEQSGGREWDYVFRRLFYASNSGVKDRQFGDVLEVDNVDQTAGHIINLDLWLGKDGSAHLLYLKHNVAGAAMRNRFFPGLPLAVSLEHCVVRNDRIAGRHAILAGGDDAGPEQPVYARFHATPGGRLFAVACVRSRPAAGKAVFENRLIEILPGLRHSEGARLDLRHPFVNFLTATERGGSLPSNRIDILGICQGPSTTIRYAAVRI